MNDISESTVYVRSFQFETLPIIFSLKESKSTFHIPSKCFALDCVSTLTKTERSVDGVSVLVNLTTYGHGQDRFPAILFASLLSEVHWLVTHLHVSHIFVVSISFPAITIIPHSSRKDSNRKPRGAYCLLLLPFSDTFSCAVFGSRNISLRDFDNVGKRPVVDNSFFFFSSIEKKGYLATFLRRIDYSSEINLRDVSDGLKYNL